MDFCGDSEIYKGSYIQALEANRDTINRINDFREELVGVRANLTENQKHLRVNVVVPFSKKAMIRGQLVHTNEVYVNLGDRWFVKTSCTRALEISERMLDRCDHNIRQWEREANLLSSNLEILNEANVFANGPLKDIVEPYDLAHETSWKEQHKERVREYRKRELDSKSTDEALSKRLDELEIEEAATRTRDKVVPIDECLDLIHGSSKNAAESKIMGGVPFDVEKFGEVLSPAENPTVCRQTVENLPETCVIYFKHSDRIRKTGRRTENEKIVSPNDLYERFLHKLPVPLSTENSLKSCHAAKCEKKGRGFVIGDIVERQFAE